MHNFVSEGVMIKSQKTLHDLPVCNHPIRSTRQYRNNTLLTTKHIHVLIRVILLLLIKLTASYG